MLLAVLGARGVYHEGRQRQARTLAKHLLSEEEAWFGASAGRGSKGEERLYEWACGVPLPDPDATQAGRWLLLRRSTSTSQRRSTPTTTWLAYYGSAETLVHELIQKIAAGRRCWSIEDGLEAAKGEVKSASMRGVQGKKVGRLAEARNAFCLLAHHARSSWWCCVRHQSMRRRSR